MITLHGNAAPHGNAASRVIRVGIGEFAVSNVPEETLTTVALGSCVAVCLWEPHARVAGLLHFLLPDSSLNQARAQREPAVFADTGIAQLFHAAYALGAQKPRCQVRLVGGAEIGGHKPAGGDGVFNVGRRNVIAARGILWRNGVLVEGEDIGGTLPRTLTMSAVDGRVTIKTDGRVVTEL
jgi:chemotaxis protein CheD